MESANAESEVSTLHLGYDDIDAVLAKAITDDCLQAGERSSYRTRANKIFLHQDLIRDEPCIVVPLQGISSKQIPSATAVPSVCVIREWTDDYEKGRAYLELRGGQVLVWTEQVIEVGASMLVLFLFDDGPFVDIIPATEGLMMDVWAHEMSAQNYVERMHDSEFDSSKGARSDACRLPIVVRRAIVVSERNAERGITPIPPVRAEADLHDSADFGEAKGCVWQDDRQDDWSDVIPFRNF